jgi:hypothetical protein
MTLLRPSGCAGQAEDKWQKTAGDHILPLPWFFQSQRVSSRDLLIFMIAAGSRSNEQLDMIECLFVKIKREKSHHGVN